MEGRFEFVEFERSLNDVWDEELGGNDWAPHMKGFRPLDMFCDIDGFVGFFVGRTDRPGLHLVHSDSSISALHVDFAGYLTLLEQSRGFLWWQNARVEFSTGAAQPNVDGFRATMPLLFPEFDYDEFAALYESLRIDR